MASLKQGGREMTPGRGGRGVVCWLLLSTIGGRVYIHYSTAQTVGYVGIGEKGTLEYMFTLILQAERPGVSAWRTHDVKSLLMNQPTYIYER